MIFNNVGNLTGVQESNITDFTPEEHSLVIEAAMLDGLSQTELETFLENSSEVNDAIRMDIVQEKSIIRLDKKAKLSRAYMTAVYNVARRKKDKKFKKIQLLWKMEAAIEKYLIKRYGPEAMREAKKSMTMASKSKGMVNKAVANVKKSLNGV